ncbi:uncharacterized protein LOC102809693 [Saccoglossus kowalevskii]|uniref:Protein hunchback-like n=1 Tax=Saccoglossus kowalevskii TaxID=10224 RepID=A0ABM0MNY6_SACKO|nr:PREDICTED: protein hunchback-like [Saccoglossus kowalevskii]
MMTNRRIRVLDNAPRPFKCTLCPQAFKQKGHLVQHLRIHTGTKPYRCELCGYASTIRGNLTAHTKLRHNNTNANKRTRLRCPHCGLYFKFIDTLQVHIASRHFGAVNAGRQNDNQTIPPVSSGFSSPQAAQNSFDRNVDMQHINTTRSDVMPVSIATSAPTLSSDSVIFQNQPAVPSMMSVQQWEVIDNGSIAVRNDMMDGAASSSQSANENPVTQTDQTSSTSFSADNGAPGSHGNAVQEYDLTVPSGDVTDETGIKVENQSFTDCQKESKVSNSEASIGFSRTPMQQKLLYAAQVRTEKDKVTTVDDDSSATDAGTRQDSLEIAMDTGFVSSFNTSEAHNNQDVEEIRTVNSVISPNAVECIPSSSNSQLNIAATSSVKRIRKSRRSITSSSPVSVPRGNNLSMVSSPTMRSTHSPSSQQSINSPGINTTVHMFNQSGLSPSSPSSHAASPSRRSSLMKFKFQNKDSLLCEFCDIVFSDTIMHTIHMGWHNHQNPFQCGVCGKVCRDKYDFMCHFTRGHDST